MTTTQRPLNLMSNYTQGVLVDKLRACHTAEEILEFEKWFNTHTENGPLHIVICNFLRTRSISRSVAAKWLSTIINDRDKLNIH